MPRYFLKRPTCFSVEEFTMKSFLALAAQFNKKKKIKIIKVECSICTQYFYVL